jgi:hypothetical protein
MSIIINNINHFFKNNSIFNFTLTGQKSAQKYTVLGNPKRALKKLGWPEILKFGCFEIGLISSLNGRSPCVRARALARLCKLAATGDP